MTFWITVSDGELTVNEINREIRLKPPDISNCLLFEQHFLKRVREGEEARPDCFHEEQILRLGEVGEDFEFGLVECCWLYESIAENRIA